MVTQQPTQLWAQINQTWIHQQQPMQAPAQALAQAPAPIEGAVPPVSNVAGPSTSGAAPAPAQQGISGSSDAAGASSLAGPSEQGPAPVQRADQSATPNCPQKWVDRQVRLLLLHPLLHLPSRLRRARAVLQFPRLRRAPRRSPRHRNLQKRKAHRQRSASGLVRRRRRMSLSQRPPRTSGRESRKRRRVRTAAKTSTGTTR